MGEKQQGEQCRVDHVTDKDRGERALQPEFVEIAIGTKQDWLRSPS